MPVNALIEFAPLLGPLDHHRLPARLRGRNCRRHLLHRILRLCRDPGDSTAERGYDCMLVQSQGEYLRDEDEWATYLRTGVPPSARA